MYDIIMKKRNGGELTRDEIRFFVAGCCEGSIPDYQTSALLMAIWFRGMTEKETLELTIQMLLSGDTVDLSGIKGLKVDKHSTGGVGDKTTLAIAPIAAACGLKVAKMSGRGLGHTGGTIDKLESIPGFNTSLSRQEFVDIVNTTGLCVAGQTGNLVPADKKLYGLRDVTATVDSLPLIASSIMSKKLAAGADIILLDVKYGSGSFMGDPEHAVRLAQLMVKIGEGAGKRTAALITNMDIPLGYSIGNSLEMVEAVNTLRGQGSQDFRRLVRALSSQLLFMAGKGDRALCEELVEKAISDGSALNKLRDMITAQGGDARYIDEPESFPRAAFIEPVTSPEDGYIQKMDTASIGRISVSLGAGRDVADGKIDHSAGLVLNKKTGDEVKKGDVLAWLHTNRHQALESAKSTFLSSLTFSDAPPEKMPLIYATIDTESEARRVKE
jgi:pyrimidine-nucleoside phosphorylase